METKSVLYETVNSTLRVADEECNDIEQAERQPVDRVRRRNAPDQNRPAQIRGNHELPPPAEAVGQGARMEREEEVWRQARRGEISHLRGTRVQGEDCDEGQRNETDLVT